MASVVIGQIHIYYSTVDGSIYSFEEAGRTLYDRGTRVEIVGWQDRLLDIIEEYGLDRNDGLRHAFVIPLLLQLNAREQEVCN